MTKKALYAELNEVHFFFFFYSVEFLTYNLPLLYALPSAHIKLLKFYIKKGNIKVTQKLFSLFNTSDFHIQRSMSILFSHLGCLKNRGRAGLICFFTASVLKTNSFKEMTRPFDLEPEIQAELY